MVLAGAVGSVLWGAVVDRAGAKRPRNKLVTLAVLCVCTMLVLRRPSGHRRKPPV